MWLWLAVLGRSTAAQQVVVFVGCIECTCTAVIACYIDPPLKDTDPKLVGFWNNRKSEKGQLTVE
jgi:hypothetical protein